MLALAPSYIGSDIKQVGREKIVDQWLARMLHPSNAHKKHWTITVLPGEEWEFEEYLYSRIKDTDLTFSVFAYERKPHIFKKCNKEVYIINKIGYKAFKRLNIQYIKSDIFNMGVMVPTDIIYADLCAGFLQKNFGRLRNILRGFGDAVSLFYITLDRQWRYKRHGIPAEVKSEECQSIIDEAEEFGISVSDANATVLRIVVPKYLPVNQLIFSYDYKNRVESNKATFMSTLGYNFSSTPINEFCGNYDRDELIEFTKAELLCT